jgi:hypothetical protein
VTDAGGATSLMNEPAEPPLHHSAQARRDRAALGAGQRRAFSSFIAMALVSADQRRVWRDRPQRPENGRGDAGRKRSPARSCPSTAAHAVVTILHDRREAIEKALLYDS